jgi:HK97 family phage major capsid protein
MIKSKMAKNLPTSKTQQRSVELDRSAINEDERTVELAFSSEEPVERSFGREVLDHDPKSVNLSRLNGGAPLLLEHDRGEQIGVVEDARIDPDKMGRATVRFSKAARAQEIFQDVLDGIRRMVSVGYRVDEFVQDSVDGDGPETYRAKSWSPLEVSIVSIPADTSVGIARGEDEPETETEPETEPEPQPAAEPVAERSETIMEQKTEPTIEVKADKRAENIAAIGRQFKASDEALSFIAEGKSADQFKDYLLEQRANEPVAVPSEDREIGLSDKEVGEYSLQRAILAAANGRPQEAGLEMEASQAVAKRFGTTPKGFYVPADVESNWNKRDLTAGASGAGAKLVPTITDTDLISVLRSKLVVADAGARFLSGLSGTINIPKVTAGAAAAFVSENSAVAEQTQTIGQVQMTPKTLGAFTDISRTLLIQSAVDVENMVRDDLTSAIAVKLDDVAIEGAGSNEPSGILNDSDAGVVALGTNGAVPTFANIVALMTEVEKDNALSGPGTFITTPQMRGKMLAVAKHSGGGDGFIMDTWGEFLGTRVLASNGVPSDLTKGSGSALHAIIFGCFQEMMVGQFGPGLDILTDPYTGSAAGTVRVRALLDVDVAIRQGQSFSYIKDGKIA